MIIWFVYRLVRNNRQKKSRSAQDEITSDEHDLYTILLVQVTHLTVYGFENPRPRVGNGSQGKSVDQSVLSDWYDSLVAVIEITTVNGNATPIPYNRSAVACAKEMFESLPQLVSTKLR